MFRITDHQGVCKVTLKKVCKYRQDSIASIRLKYLLNCKDQFVTQYITYLKVLGDVFKEHCVHLQPKIPTYNFLYFL